MNKYVRLKEELETLGTGKMKVFGQSMLPIIHSGSVLTFERRDSYEVGDVVFSKVKGRYIDAHKITKKDPNRGYLISNNHGFDNGWTRAIFGKVTVSEYQGTLKKH